MRTIRLKFPVDREGRRRIIIKKNVGQQTPYPSANDKKDFSLVFFHNMDVDTDVYVKYRNGITYKIRHMDIDMDYQGVYVMEEYGYAPSDIKDNALLRDSIYNSAELNEYFEDPDILKKVIELHTKPYNQAEIDDSGTNGLYLDPLHRDFKEYRYATKNLRLYKFVDIKEFSTVNHIMLEDYNIMISVGDYEAPFPSEPVHDSLKNGFSITIRNSKNPLKVYYANVCGEVVSIPVKNDNKAEDGIIISKYVMGKEVVNTYALEDAEALGIFENEDDAIVGGDKTLQLKMKELDTKEKELETKMKGFDRSEASDELKLKLEQLNAEIEEKNMKLREQQNELEREKLEHEREMMKIKEELERIKARTTETKSNNESTASWWKAAAAIVAGAATIVGAIWKFFF